MTKRLFASVAVVGMGALLAAGCGNSGTGATCSTNSDCTSGQVCASGACVTGCTQDSDCPQEQPHCLANTEGQLTCQCQTDQECGGAPGNSTVCMVATGNCGVKCGSDADCPSGLTCDTASGQCVTSTTACQSDTDCPSGETCDTGTGTCVGSSQSCDSANENIGANGGPDVCAYGSTCSSSNMCEAVEPACDAALSAPGEEAWDQTAQAAPVIVSVTAVGSQTSDSSTECGDGGPKVTFTVEYYSKTGFTSQTAFADWKNQVQVAANFDTGFVMPAFGDNSPTVNADFGTFSFGVCTTSATATSGTGAVFLVDEAGNVGNTLCTSW